MAALDATIALCQQRWSDAVREANRQSVDDAAARMTSARLKAFAHLGRISEMRAERRLADAVPFISETLQLVVEQLDVRRSDPLLYEFLALSWISEMEVAAGTGTDPETTFHQARAAIEAALTADPQMSTAHRVLAHASLVLGAYQGRHGTDPRPALESAAAKATISDRSSPRRGEASPQPPTSPRGMPSSTPTSPASTGSKPSTFSTAVPIQSRHSKRPGSPPTPLWRPLRGRRRRTPSGSRFPWFAYTTPYVPAWTRAPPSMRAYKRRRQPQPRTRSSSFSPERT